MNSKNYIPAHMKTLEETHAAVMGVLCSSEYVHDLPDSITLVENESNEDDALVTFAA